MITLSRTHLCDLLCSFIVVNILRRRINCVEGEFKIVDLLNPVFAVFLTFYLPPLFCFNLCAGDYQAGAWGSFSTAAAAADGFHSNQPAATRRHGVTPVCRSEGRSHDLHVGPETGWSRRGDHGEQGRCLSRPAAFCTTDARRQPS